MIVEGESNQVRVVFLANGFFESEIFLSVGVLPVDLALGDLDGNNRIDVIVADNGSATVSIVPNLGRPGDRRCACRPR